MSTEPKVLKQFACFESLSDEQVNALAQISNSVCYMKDHVLFEEGEPGKILYLLIDGQVEVYYKDTETGQHRVDTVSSQEAVGCSAFVPPYIYTATEKCLTDVEVLEIEIEEFRDLIQNEPHIGLVLQEHIIKVLNERILALRHRAIG